MVVTLDQIAAATRIHDELMPGWAATDRALTLLAERAPETNADAAMLKAATVNLLYNGQCRDYGTLVPFIVRCVGERAGPAESRRDAVAIVRAVAQNGTEITGKWYWSLASKFVHWFVGDAAPMYDAWACKAIKRHLPTIRWGDPPDYYPRFVEATGKLREASGLNCTARELDRYLWLSGMCRAWQDGDGSLSREVRDLFASGDLRVRRTLEALMGEKVQARGVV